MSLFEIMQPLGRGSYGIVYKARCLRSGILVAVKQISLEQVRVSIWQRKRLLLGRADAGW